MLIETVSHTLKKRARSLITFIIIMLVLWRTNSWTTSINRLNMQLLFVSLLNIALISIFSIITLTIEQTTTYMRRKKTTRVTISFKCTDFVKLNLIESTCIFFSFISFDCAMIFLSFNIVFIFSSMMLRNICLNNSREISNNSWRRISINVFSICLITSIKFNYSLMICVNFLNFFVISTTSTELNLINFIFLYLTAREFELILMRIFFIATSAREILINFESLLKTTLFVGFTAFESFLLWIFFIASRITFFYFRFFMIRANYFSKDFHEILRTEKSFSCRATRIFINIFSL